jgi:hypothetical protein
MEPKRRKKPVKASVLDVDLSSGMSLLEEERCPARPTTAISDLIHNDALILPNMTFNYKNNTKRTVLTMKDYYTQKRLGIATEDQCWWDRHPFQTTPIGIPLEYHCRQEKKSHFMKRIETKSKKSKEETVIETPMVKTDVIEEHFLTEGVVCSFPCALAYIRQEVRHDRRYRESESLLYFMYKMLHDIPMSEKVMIPVAGKWSIIAGCGGDVPISQYRQDYCRLVYDITPSVKRPLMIPVSRIVEVRPLN